MKTSIRLFAAILFIAAVPLTAVNASVFEAGKSVTIPKTELEADNLYLAGGQVTFSTTAQKDIVAAGGTVIVGGQVYGDALLAGGNVMVLNDVRGDIRAAGGQVHISGLVGGDVLAAGGSVTIEPGAVVAGDVMVAGGAVDIEGTVNGQVSAYGGNVTVNSTIAGPVSIKAGKSVMFGEKAVLGNGVSYAAPAEAIVVPGAKIGDNVTFLKQGANMDGRSLRGIFFAILGFLFVAKFIAILVAALVMVLVFGSFSQTLSERTLAHFWKKTLVGFVTLIVTPVAIVLLGITLIGIYLAMFLGLVYLMALVLASVYMCVLAGGILSKWIRKDIRADWKWTILGTVAVFLLTFVPIVGWMIDFFLMLAALGAVTLSIHRDAKEKM